MSSPWSAHQAAHEQIDRALEATLRSTGEPLALVATCLSLDHFLARHIRVEEDRVLPRFRDLCPDHAPAGEPGQFELDHSLIRTRMQTLQEVGLRASVGDASAAFLRHSAVRLKETLEHHAHREEQHLYPALAERLGSAELEELDAAFTEVPLILQIERGRIAGDLALAAVHSGYRSFCHLRDRTGGPDTLNPPRLPEHSPKALTLLLRRVVTLSNRFLRAAGVSDIESATAEATAEATVDEAWRSALKLALGHLMARENCGHAAADPEAIS